MLTRKAVVGSR